MSKIQVYFWSDEEKCFVSAQEILFSEKASEFYHKS